MRTHLMLLAVAPAVLAGCLSSSTEIDSQPCAPFLHALSPVAGDTVMTEIGLQYIEIRVGSGPDVVVGNAILVHSAGYLADGTRIDFTCDRSPYEVIVGGGFFIPGYEAGMLGMRPDGVRRLVIPPELAFGEVPPPGIPPGATLVFDVHIVHVF